jgi:uncharacterized membrane protein YhaH (DUF805 family)
MSDTPAPVSTNPLAVLFSYRGRIGRGKYWLALLIAVAMAFLALVLFAAMMSSTGAGGAPVFLALPLVFLFAWIFSAATVKRLRDAGWPWWAQVAFGLAPVPWVYATLEDIESIGGLIALVLLVLFIVPGILRSKPTA